MGLFLGRETAWVGLVMARLRYNWFVIIHLTAIGPQIR